MKRVLWFLGCLLLATRVEATSYYIAASASSDSNPCSIASPCATFAHVVNSVMAPGDTLYARGGNYDQTVVITASGTNWTTGALTITNYPSETPWIKPTSGSGTPLAFPTGTAPSYQIWTGINIDGISVTDGSQNVYIGHDAHHIRIQDAQNKNADWTGIQCFGGNSSFIELINLEIFDGGRLVGGDAAHGIYMSGTSGAATGTNTHNLFERNNIHGFTRSLSAGIQLFAGVDQDQIGGVTIRKNHLHGNGIGATLADHQTVPALVYSNVIEGNISGIWVYGRIIGPKIYNNTIYGNSDWGIDVGPGYYARAVLIKNNAITSNTSGPIIIRNTDGTSYATIQYNGLNGNGNSNAVNDQNVLSTVSNTVTAAPLYTNAGAGDFTLQVGSPYIDAAVTLADVPDDYIDTARPQGGVYDISAYEAAVSGPPSINTPGGGLSGASGSRLGKRPR